MVRHVLYGLPDDDWRQVLAQLETLQSEPVLIVASHLADEDVWAEVLNLGTYEVLLKPFRAEEVARTIEAVCDSRFEEPENREDDT